MGKLSREFSSVERHNALPDTDYQKRLLPDLGNTLRDIKHEPQERDPADFGMVTSFGTPQTMSEDEFIECFALIEETSATDYRRSTLGWKPAAKRQEMRLDDMRYIMVYLGPINLKPELKGLQTYTETMNNETAELAAFASFMLTFEDGCEVVYCYEVHVKEQFRRLGIGAKLVQTVEAAGARSGMSKAMLTVFAGNSRAMQFYRKLGYSIDASSPQAKTMRNGSVKESSYHILSKALMQS